MSKSPKDRTTAAVDQSRRKVLRTIAALGASSIAAPYLMRHAHAQGADLGPTSRPRSTGARRKASRSPSG